MSDDPFGEIHLEHLPAMRVACCQAIGGDPEEQASERMRRWRSRRGLSVECRHFGCDIDVPAAAARAGLRGYEVWTTVPASVASDDEVTVVDVAGGSYAAMTITDALDDPFALIPAGWERLRAWVEATPGVTSDGRPWLEELVERDGHRDLVLLHPIH